MAEEQKNGLSEATETGAPAVQVIHRAIKTGKVVLAAAKGAVVGGSHGATVGAVLAGRRYIDKIVMAIAVLVMLSVLSVSMLPGLLFDGLIGSGSSGTDGLSVLNDGQAVVENANGITLFINQILSEGPVSYAHL